jgi:hypothetical protein
MNLEYRLVRYPTDETDGNQANYGVHPCYVDANGNVIGRVAGDPLVSGVSQDAILSYLRSILEAINKPVVDDAQRVDSLAVLYDVPAPSPDDSAANAEYV